MISTLICGLALLAPVQYTCPVAGHEAPADGPKMDYAGVRYQLCCADCVPAFAKEPAKFAVAKDKSHVIGTALFDMSTGKRIEMKDAKATLTLGGVVYPFASEAGKQAFATANKDKAPKLPAKEALYCPVMKHGIASVDKAFAFVDHEGVRYYICCAGCLAPMKNEPAKYVGNAKAAVKDAKAVEVKKG